MCFRCKAKHYYLLFYINCLSFLLGLRCKFLPTNFYRSILYIQLTPIANFRTTYPHATIKSNINSIRVSRIGTINILVTHCRIATLRTHKVNPSCADTRKRRDRFSFFFFGCNISFEPQLAGLTIII